MASKALLQQLKQRVEYVEEEREREFCCFSEKLARQIKDSNEILGAFYRKVDTMDARIKTLEFDNIIKRDRIIMRDETIKCLEKRQNKLVADHAAEVTYLQQRLMTMASERQVLKEQQKQRLLQEEQQHRQMFQLKQQVARLVTQNKKLLQEACQAEALLQQLNQTQVMSCTAQELKADKRSSSSSVKAHCSSPGGPELSQFPSAVVSDNSANISDDADATCIISNTLSNSSDVVINTGSIPAGSMEPAAATDLPTASSSSSSGNNSNSSAGTSQQGVCLEGCAWQKFFMVWEEGWYGAH